MKECRAYFVGLIKSNYALWLAITILMTLFSVLTTAVFGRFMQSSFYSTVVTLFPVIYAVVACNKLIAEKVDKGTMSGFLIANITRVKLVVTSAVFFVLSTFVLWFIATSIGLLAGVIADVEMNVRNIVMLNLGAFLYHLAIGGICFLSSCIFNTSRLSLAIGGGISIAFYLFGTLGEMIESLNFLKYMTISTLFDATSLYAGEPVVWQYCTLAGIAILLYTIGVFVFKKKDLPI